MGPRRRRRGDRRASPSTRPTSWATSCSSSCRPSASALEQFADVRRGRVGQGRQRPVRARRRRGGRRRTTRWPTSRSSSTASRSARAGWSGCGSPTRRRSTTCSTPRPTSASSPRADRCPTGPHAADDRARMLESDRRGSVDDLFEDIPAAPARDARCASIPPEPELELSQRLAALAARNRSTSASFLGAGAYRHWTPPAVDQLLLPRRVVHGLHAVPARGQPGHAAEHLRVPVAARRADRPRRRLGVATTTAARRPPRRR